MGIPGAGKSRVAEDYVARGYLRLNRDERGGSLRELAAALDDELASGARRVVLDNTYLTRAARSHVLEAAGRHGVAGALRLARHAARAGAGQPRRADARAVRRAPDPRRAERARAARAGRARADLADARAPRARAAVARRGLRARRAGAVRARAPAARPRRRLRRGRGAGQPGWEHAPEQGDPSAPHLLFDWSPDGTADALAGRRPASRPRSPVRSRARSAHTPAARRPAGAARRSRACRSRSRAPTASTRRARSSSARARAPDARDDARRPLRLSLHRLGAGDGARALHGRRDRRGHGPRGESSTAGSASTSRRARRARATSR